MTMQPASAKENTSTSKIHQYIKFCDESLLRKALTHRSYVHEHPEAGENNERLEFLGDALLTFLSGEYLFRCYPDIGEDELTRRRSALVNEEQLAKFALSIGLSDMMLLGRGAILDGGRSNANLLSSTFEALVAAYFIDSNRNIETVRVFVEPLFHSVPENMVVVRSNVDSKNRFQEWVQRNITTTPPKYITVQAGGTSHAPEFISQVTVDGKVYGQGKGRRKGDAQKAAAEDALKKLQQQGML